ncbi:Uncharacterized protein APZ42_034198, partial [Daphnia magna]
HSDVQPLPMFLSSMGNPSFTGNHPSPSSGAVQNRFSSTDANTQAAAWFNFPMLRLQTTQNGVAHVESTLLPTFNTAPAFQVTTPLGRSQSQQIPTPQLSTNQPLPVNNQPFLFNLPVQSPLSSADINARPGSSIFQLQRKQGAIAHIRPTTFTPFNTARALKGNVRRSITIFRHVSPMSLFLSQTLYLLSRTFRNAKLSYTTAAESERTFSRTIARYAALEFGTTLFPAKPATRIHRTCPTSIYPHRYQCCGGSMGTISDVPTATDPQLSATLRNSNRTDPVHVRPPPLVSSSTAQALKGLLQPQTRPTRQPSNLRTRSSALPHVIPLPHSGRSCSLPNQLSASCESGEHPLIPPDANALAEAWLRSPMFQPQTTQRPDARRVRPAPPVTSSTAPSLQRGPAGPSHGMSIPSSGRSYFRLTQPSASKELARLPFTPEAANAQANAWLRSPVFQTPTAQRPTAHVGPTVTALSKTELVSQGGEPQPYPFVAVQDAVPSDIAGTSKSYVHSASAYIAGKERASPPGPCRIFPGTKYYSLSNADSRTFSRRTTHTQIYIFIISGPPTRRQPAQSSIEPITSPAQDGMFGPSKRPQPAHTSGGSLTSSNSGGCVQPLTPRGPSLADIHEPTIQQLKQFERDPVTALVSLAINSENPDTLQILQTIAEEIEAGFTDDGRNPRARIVKTFQHAIDLKAQLFGCVSCGIRTFQMGTEESTLYHDEDILQLPKLQLSPDEVGRLTSVPVDFRSAISHFRSTTGAYFHLHPEFVTAARNETCNVTSETAKLCAGCWYHLGK